MKSCRLGKCQSKNTVVFRKMITVAVFEPPGKEFHHLFNWNGHTRNGEPLFLLLSLTEPYKIMITIIITLSGIAIHFTG